jgi:hypothetical protein
MRISRSILTVLSTGAALALAGCNEALVPDFNTTTGFPHAVSSLQSEMTGVFNGLRALDVFNMAIEMDAFARSATYFTPSESRFVTELTGSALLDDDNFGANVWANPFTTIKTADTVLAILPTLRQSNGSAYPAAGVKALQGVIQTHKAFDYMYVALAHDTNGVAMGNPGGSFTGTLAPIVCARNSWAEIVAMLDTAKAELDAAGAGTSLALGSDFTLQMPPGYGALGSTAGGFQALTLALRGRARIEYAYAIARGPGGTAPTATTPGAPDQAQLDSAITDIKASALYSPTLTGSEAIAANDNGVFMSFSGASGDVANPIFGISGSVFVLEGAAQQIDTLHDQRFLAKFGVAPAAPTSVGASIASSYAYLNNIGLSTPMPMIRNVELQFLLARAYLGTGQLVQAAQTVDAVRTTVGGLASGLGSVNTSDYASVRDFLMREMLPSLMEDATGDQITAIRDYGLIMQDLTTWGAKDFHASMLNIPAPEREQRNNNFAAVCP